MLNFTWCVGKWWWDRPVLHKSTPTFKSLKIHDFFGLTSTASVHDCLGPAVVGVSTKTSKILPRLKWIYKEKHQKGWLINGTATILRKLWLVQAFASAKVQNFSEIQWVFQFFGIITFVIENLDFKLAFLNIYGSRPVLSTKLTQNVMRNLGHD